jgi:hypothetical protein
MDVAYDDQVYVDDRTIGKPHRLRKKMRTADDNFRRSRRFMGIGYPILTKISRHSMTVAQKIDAA